MKYEAPNAEILLFASEDILSGSDGNETEINLFEHERSNRDR